MIGTRVLALLAAVVDERTLRDVIEPHVADVQAEWCAAKRAGRHARALVIRLRGIWALLSIFAALGPRSAWRAIEPAPLVALALIAAIGSGIALIARTSPELARLQALWAAIALGGFALGAALPRRFWHRAAPFFALLGATAIALAHAFGDGRFVTLGIPLAPAEIAKPLLAAALATAVAERRFRLVLALVLVLVLDLLLSPTLSPVPHIEDVATGAHAPLPLTLLALGASLALAVILLARARAARSPLALGIATLFALELVAFAAGAHALPLVSYGGSGLLGTALGIGIALSATRPLDLRAER
jgi:cell division protein FtsW (lipid II flippase)